MSERILSSYTTFSLRHSAWKLPPVERAELVRELIAAVSQTSETAWCYQVFPARAEYDFFIWSTVKCNALDTPDAYFKAFATALSPFRRDVDTPLVLTGITKPSVYVRKRENSQEIDPFAGERRPYFVIYPFMKTAEWYLTSKEDRQQMMTGHIRLGHQYPEIKQLLLYSFGIQDQEFIVAYEMDDLPMFSDLVQDLRSTAARAYTQLDTPIITGALRTPEEMAGIIAAEKDA